MRVLLTGGAGFIGHHIVDHVLRHTDWRIVVLDRLEHGGNLNRLAEVMADAGPDARHRVAWQFHDLRAPLGGQLIRQIGDVDAVLHVAASTHVDRSILSPIDFVWDNVLGTAHILDYARQADIGKFVYFGTDEVFGPAPPGVLFKEWDRYKSGNPYSATKAGAEELALAYHNTYRLPVIITHTMNVFGERQHPEKYIPMTVRKVRDGDKVTVHANADRTKAGSRFYIHAKNVAAALLFLLEKGAAGEKYNIVGEKEVDNLLLAQTIAAAQGKPLDYEMVDFHSARPGHDLRYALSGEKMASMGWKPPLNFETALDQVVRWTLDNPRWLL